MNITDGFCPLYNSGVSLAINKTLSEEESVDGNIYNVCESVCPDRDFVIIFSGNLPSKS